jgi:hypothetical protein
MTPTRLATLLVLVAALVVTLGARSAAPDAIADVTDQTFETDDHVITMAPDGTVTVVSKRTQIAVQGTANGTSPALTAQELLAKAHGITEQLKRNLGWDLTSELDRARALNETEALTQQLHNIPQATLDLEENADLLQLRDIVDEMDIVDDIDGVNNCRGRCLSPGAIKTVIAGPAMSKNLRTLKSYLTQGKPLSTAVAVEGVALVCTLLAIFWVTLERDLGNLPERFKWAVCAVLTGMTIDVLNTFSDVADYVAHSRATMRQEVTDAARHLDSLTPDDEPATDYDLAKDEL